MCLPADAGTVWREIGFSVLGVGFSNSKSLLWIENLVAETL